MNRLQTADQGVALIDSAVAQPAQKRLEINDNGSVERISDLFTRSFVPIFKNNSNIYQLFFSATKKLNKFFSLSRTVLVVKSPTDGNLKVIALKSKKNAREGLALSLPTRRSMLYAVAEKNELYIQNFPEKEKGNFIERKLMFDKDSSSLAICPINFNNRLQGLLCLSSPMIYAFSMFENGFLDNVLEQLGEKLESEISRLNI